MQTGQSWEIKSQTDLLSLTCRNTFINTHTHTLKQIKGVKHRQTDTEDAESR